MSFTVYTVCVSLTEVSEHSPRSTCVSFWQSWIRSHHTRNSFRWSLEDQIHTQFAGREEGKKGLRGKRGVRKEEEEESRIYAGTSWVYSVSMATYLESKADLSGNVFLSGCEEDWVSFLFALFISLHFTIQCLSVCVCVCACVCVQHACVCVCVCVCSVHACVCVCVGGEAEGRGYVCHIAIYNSLILWQ